MKIKKRDGHYEQLSFDKIIYRLRKLCQDKSLGPLTNIDPDVVAQRVVSGIYDGVTSCELDEEAARIAVGMTENLEYQQLASRIIISNLHKSTIECFSEVMEKLYNNVDKSGQPAPVIAEDVIQIIRENKNKLNYVIEYQRDYNFDYFGYKTLEKSYLQKLRDNETDKMKVVERPQHLYMRVAIGIHKNDIDSAIKTYHLISQHFYTHASPTLFNAGTRLASLSSCFLIGSNDSIEGIYKTITDCGRISKVGGGIGVHISNIRAKGSVIRGTNGISDGIVPMLKVYNATAAYVNQSGKRKGSFAIYIEPWHADILEFLELKKNQGHDDIRARDLFYALWTPDLFMKQVECDGDWYLMCPDECPGLTDAYGDAFEELYWKYVEEKRYKKVIKAQEVWKKVLESQIETGVPYIGYKDAVNKKCNQKNLGTIKSSNLCLEISLYSDDKEYACCNLCSIALPKYVKYDENDKPYFDHDHLSQIAEYVIGPMNKVIDENYYPTEETRLSNMKHRPLAIGIQGLADVYCKMRIPFESDEAKQLNIEIAETVYYGCMKGSIDIAKKDGPYESFQGSPFSEGKLQFDLAAEFDGIDLSKYLSGRWDWDALKADLKEYGARNSMLVALMPTASSAQIMNNSECLASGTKVSMRNGLSCNIEDMFENNSVVYGWNDTTKSIQLSNQVNTLNQGIKPTVQLMFSDGQTLVCTPDHKLLTTHGWKEAKDIQLHKDDIVCGVENTFDEKFDDEHQFLLDIGNYKFKMTTHKERQRTLAFARILGYTLSDGCTSTCGEVAVYPNTQLDAESILDDLSLIDGSRPKVSKNTVGLRIRLNKSLSTTILSLAGITPGRRTTNGLTFPHFLLKDCPKAVIREFLAAHFGGDGAVPTFKNGVLSGMDITHNVDVTHIQVLNNTMEQLKDMFKALDINTTVSVPYKTADPTKYRIRLRIPPNQQFLEKVGVRYCIQKQYKITVSTCYWRMREKSTQQRESIIHTALELHNNQNLPKTKALKYAINNFLEHSTPVSTYSVPSYTSLKYYSNKDTINIKHQNILKAERVFDKMKCRHWFKPGHIITTDSESLPFFVKTVIDRRDNGSMQVWDISVDQTHSFVANGTMVHNCFEPIDSCIFKRRVLSGEYMVVNKYLVKDLEKLGLWSKEMKNTIIARDGSIQDIPEIPDDIKGIYKTVWEMSMKTVIEQCKDRGVFVDQMQSMNLFVSNPTYKKLTSMHFYAWKNHLKSGMYYLRSKNSASAGKFSIDADLEKKIRSKQEAGKKLTKKEETLLCSIDNKEDCMMCTS